MAKTRRRHHRQRSNQRQRSRRARRAAGEDRRQHVQRERQQARRDTAPMYRRALQRVVDGAIGRRLHAKQALSIFMVAFGVLLSDRLGVAAIGRAMARRGFGRSPKHGIKQVDRCLSNDKLSPYLLFGGYVPFIVGQRQNILVTIDWTEFDKDDHSLICVSLVTQARRAVPLVWKTVRKSWLKGRQRSHERHVLRQLAEYLPPDVHVTVLADRGFGDVNLYRYIHRSLGFDFVIRFRPNIKVEVGGGLRKASELVPRNGRARVLRDVGVTAKRCGPWTVALTKARGMKESWCLATSLTDVDGRRIVKLYGKRFQCEEGFRDLKDRRFGYGLRFTKIKRCDRRDRMLFLFCLAYVVLLLMGATSERLGLDRLLRANTVSERTHSLFRQGRELLGELAREIYEAVAATLWDSFNSLSAKGLLEAC